jgi:hypothetical protein
MKTFTAQQSALFKVQKHHLRAALKLEREARYYARNDRPDSASVYKGQATRHRRMIDAITPFLMPHGPTGSVCLCALSYLFASFFC